MIDNELEARLKKIQDWCLCLDERMSTLESNKTCSCQPQMLKTIELEIEWPETDTDGLHFNFQRTKSVFELKKDGWWHSRDILFLSARNPNDDNIWDILSAYLKQGSVNEAFYQALKKAGVFDKEEEDKNVTIALPKENEGVKKYNGADCGYWLFPAPSGSTSDFCYVNSIGTVFSINSSYAYGCAPAFSITEAEE